MIALVMPFSLLQLVAVAVTVAILVLAVVVVVDDDLDLLFGLAMFQCPVVPVQLVDAVLAVDEQRHHLIRLYDAVLVIVAQNKFELTATEHHWLVQCGRQRNHGKWNESCESCEQKFHDGRLIFLE